MGSEMSSEEADISDAVETENTKFVSEGNLYDANDLPGREEGDGMELPVVAPKMDPPPAHPSAAIITDSIVSDILVDASNAQIKLPDIGGLSLETLPPPRDDKFLDLSPPAKPLIAERKIKRYPKGSLPPAVKKQREPKFVPYEPYKAAVANMGTETAWAKDRLNISSRGNFEEGELAKSFNTSLERGEVGKGEADEGEMNSNFDRNYQIMMEIKENEIECLKAQVENAEKQLKIQTKVNTEVKKLLVASVGEDIEARVDFLTQDKARLAADVIQYNNRFVNILKGL